MELADLLRKTLDVDSDEIWWNECTPTPNRVFGVRLHSMGLSVREVIAVLELLDVDRSHGAIWNWTQTLAEAQGDPPTRNTSWSRARQSGCMRRSTWSQSYSSRLTSTAAAGPIPWRRFCIGSPRNTTSPMLVYGRR